MRDDGPLFGWSIREKDEALGTPSTPVDFLCHFSAAVVLDDDNDGKDEDRRWLRAMSIGVTNCVRAQLKEMID